MIHERTNGNKLLQGQLQLMDDWQTGIGMLVVAWNGPPIRFKLAWATADTPVDEVNAYMDGLGKEADEAEEATLALVVRASTIALQDEIERLEGVLAMLKKKALGEVAAAQMKEGR